MGVGRPQLPAPTESIVDTMTGGSVTGTDLATDVSRRTDKTSYSIPDDGREVTISTRRKPHKRDAEESSKLSRSSHRSHTSLLIEYFEGGKGPGNLSSRPSVRVKVTPSGARRLKDQADHIQISESTGKKPFYSRRISLGTHASRNKQLPEAAGDDRSLSSDLSALDESGTAMRRPPLEIEFVDRDQGSELSNDRYLGPNSEFSSMPPDSMLDSSLLSLRRKRSQSLERGDSRENSELLKAPSRRRSRSLSRERIAYKAAQKLSSAPEAPTSNYRRSDKNSSRSASKDVLKKRSHRRREEEPPSADSSLLSGSAVSPRRKSGDQYSVRSAGSRSSITNHNPRLLDQVEDAIRRLILPELKELKKDQKIGQNKSRFERDIASQSPGSSTSKGEVGRRLSKHSSAPEVAKSTTSAKKVQEEDLFHPEDRPRELEEDYSHEEASPSDRVHSRRGSRPEYTEQEMLRRQKSKGLRDAEAAGIVGTALTFAALKHHDSKSSLDKKERKKRKHKSHSRRASMNETETELLFREHNVPPMPMRSGIVDSELTRDSILSQRSTETPTPRQDAEMFDVFRDTPRDISSPASRRPSLHTPLGTRQKSVSPAADVIAAAAAANLLDHLGDGGLEPGYGYDGHAMQRELSPVQSVASDHHELENQDPTQPDDADADSQGRDRREQRLSIDTLSSAPSTELARSTRPYGVSLESRSEILHDGAGLGYEESSKMSNVEHWGEEPHPEEDGAYRRSSADVSINDPNVDMKHLTTFTEDSLDAQYLDRASAGRQVEDGFAANPQYVHAPFAVESAVASLHEPSVLETKSIHSGRYSQSDSINRPRSGSPYSGGSATRNLPRSGQGSPLKEQQSVGSLDSTSFPQRIGATSPPQSIAQSDNDLDQNHVAEDPALEVPDEQASVVENQVPDTESEIYTNPSIIQGPIGGVSNENRDHWPYHPTPPQVTDRNIGGVTAESEAPYDHSYGQPDYGEAFALNHNPSQPKGHYIHGDIFSTPPGAKDEGYISAANPMSPSVATPEPQNKTMGSSDRNAIGVFDPSVGDDPFTTPSHLRHLSGYSHGIPSPLYDSATGRGIERIQSKDIIALMEHLMVRDAQRNARDTEILVTLVRSAAEMRNSFEEIKKFIAEQDGLLMDANEKHHERTQRVIGGPRPQSASKTTRQLTNDDYGDDVRSKRRNVFRRALQNLSLKSSHDLVRIEGMLEQLLGDVESLRATQDGRTGTGTGTKTASINSNGQTGASYQDGYEPEGQAGTSSTGGHSGYTSNSSRPFPDTRGPNVRRGSENRISTVPEGDEEAEEDEEEREGYKPQLSTPAHGRLLSREERGVSEPLATPPRVPVASGALSNETTPRKSEEKSRKHKSSSSSFFPKIMSRWSRTTASSGLKDRLQSEASRSGSDLAHGPYNTAEYYDPRGDDRLRSSYTLDDDHHQENRPPSPLVPSQLSENPKYEAHRDSFNLQHPQPRQGPTDRYQTQLESQAQNFANPRSPNSENWGSNSSLPQMNPNSNRYSREGRLTPISSNGYSDTSSLTDRKNNPPRPPKVKSDGPLIPPRPPKIKDNEQRGPTGVSPTQPTPQRKPTGPRPITQFSPSNIKRSRYRGSPDQVDPDDDY